LLQFDKNEMKKLQMCVRCGYCNNPHTTSNDDYAALNEKERQLHTLTDVVIVVRLVDIYSGFISYAK
jgi:hypothetical protein